MAYLPRLYLHGYTSYSFFTTLRVDHPLLHSCRKCFLCDWSYLMHQNKNLIQERKKYPWKITITDGFCIFLTKVLCLNHLFICLSVHNTHNVCVWCLKWTNMDKVCKLCAAHGEILQFFIATLAIMQHAWLDKVMFTVNCLGSEENVYLVKM